MEKKPKTPAFSLKVDVFSPLFVLLKKKKKILQALTMP